MRVCIIIPVYNEEAVIQNSLETILSYTSDLPAEVTVAAVNDGSQDGTETILKKFSEQYDKSKFQLISYPDNKGYGKALRVGINFAVQNNYDYAVFMDSDLTNHPRYLRDFCQKMLEGWDYIKATRYSKGGGVKGVPWKRRIISRCGNIFARLVTGLPLHDITNGFRAVKVDVLKKLELKENHFSMIIEELMKAKKITNNFCEIPFVLETRDEKARPTKFTYKPSTFWKYTKYLFFN